MMWPDKIKMFAGEDSGMSLVELLVVLAIVAFAAATMMSRIRVNPQLSIRTYASEVAAELRAVRASAISRNQSSAFRMDAQKRSFVSDVNTRERHLPSGLDASLLAARAYVRNAADAAIVFFPDGSSTGGALTLKSGSGVAKILIDWLSGRVDVEMSTP